ncbi:MAG: fasciclin domain-containing protein [Burkholderiaceae bacterium]
MNRRAWMSALFAVSLAGCASTQPQNVVQVIAADPNLSTLSKLINEAGLNETLSSAGPYTVFAPTNKAFSAVPAKTMGALAGNKEMLKQVLTYHVVASKASAADVKAGHVKTVNGADIAVARTANFVTIDEALVTGADKAATNGVVHVIDRVLLPPKR